MIEKDYSFADNVEIKTKLILDRMDDIFGEQLYNKDEALENQVAFLQVLTSHTSALIINFKPAIEEENLVFTTIDDFFKLMKILGYHGLKEKYINHLKQKEHQSP